MKISWRFWRVSVPQPVNDVARNAGLLVLRVLVGQEFLLAGWTKLGGGLQAPEWFASLNFPWPLAWLGPQLNWLAAGAGEIVLGTALVLGLFSRFAALGLLYVTYVAVYTVHFDLGWAGWNQIETEQGLGFKVPLMLGVMLFAVLTQGAGQWALDAGWHRRRTLSIHPVAKPHPSP